MKSRRASGALLVALTVALDQSIKAWVVAAMPLHSSIEVLPYLALFHTRNEGVAFSFLTGIGTTLLLVITAAVAVFIAWLWRSNPPQRVFAHLGFAMIVGGAIGNLIDRALRGNVVDYVYFHTPVWSFAVFNLADAAITIGAGLVLLDEFLDWRSSRRAADG